MDRILVLLICICFIFSCSTEHREKKTPSGYKYIHHVSHSSDKPEVGEYVFFDALLINDQDSIVQDMTDLPNMPSFEILDPNSSGYKSNPINDVLLNLAVKDSATLYIPIDSLRSKPAGFKDSEFLRYRFFIKKIMTRKAHMEELQKEKEEREERIRISKAKLPEIKTMVEEKRNLFLSGKIDDQIVTTESGLRYYIIEEGEGNTPKEGDRVNVWYYGVFPDGAMFDNSWTGGSAYPFILGKRSVIAGWDEAFLLFNKGTKAMIYVPFQLAYGERGRAGIPPKSDLMFYVELEDFVSN